MVEIRDVFWGPAVKTRFSTINSPPAEFALENSPGLGCPASNFEPAARQPGGLFFQEFREKLGFPGFFLSW
jgi:hypothetical protein